MQLPFDRRRLRERSALDEREELETARGETTEERFLLSLELAELARELAIEAGSDWVTGDVDDLSEKSRRYAFALRVVRERRA